MAAGPDTSYPTSLSAAVDLKLKQQCGFTVSVCVSDNSDVIFRLQSYGFDNTSGF
jgi:hypothetical protein